MILILFILFALLLFLKFKVFSLKEPDKADPPAVPGSLPIFGHLLALGVSPHLKLIEWAKVHGSLFTVNLGGEKALVVDDPILMREIFSQHAFSGRAENKAVEYFSEGKNGIISSEGKHWEIQRRFTLKQLRDFGFGKCYIENLIAGEVNDVLDSLRLQANKPVVVRGIFNLAVVNALWILTSGERLSAKDSILTKLLLDAIKYFNKILTTGAMYSPLIRWLVPKLSGWKDFTSSCDDLHKFYRKTTEDHTQNHDEFNPRDLIDANISQIKSCKDPASPFYEETGYKNLRATIGDIFLAGSETTSTTLTWTILFLTVHTEVQGKLQSEIDKVVGRLRKPSLSDRPKMPYVEAVISEVLRKSSLVPLGVSHRALVDTEFNGFMIRKGTTIIGNLYSAHHSSQYWDEPGIFKPERFLTADGLELIKKPEALIPFQVGRRQCLGEQFAKDNLFLFITSFFQAFTTLPDITGPRLDLEPIPGFNLNPKLYSVILQERN